MRSVPGRAGRGRLMDRRCRIALDDAAGTLHVTAAGRPLLAYVFRPGTPAVESPRPYFHPVRTWDGTVVTGFRPADHPWHHGLSLALAHVGHHNFWGGPTFTGQRYEQLDNNGRVVHLRFAAVTDDGGAAAFTEELRWCTSDGTLLLEEQRRVRVAAHPSCWTLALRTRLRNRSGEPLELGSPGTAGRPDAGYGGLFWRGADAFRDGGVDSPAGAVTEAVRGDRAAWLGCATPARTRPQAAVVIVDDVPAGAAGPAWFVRTSDYPGLNPAPFFRRPHRLADGAHLDLSSAVVVAGGSAAADPAALAEIGRSDLEAARG